MRLQGCIIEHVCPVVTSCMVLLDPKRSKWSSMLPLVLHHRCLMDTHTNSMWTSRIGIVLKVGGELEAIVMMIYSVLKY